MNSSPILYINNFVIDLLAGQTIGQTKQVNDFGNLENRQNNFTNRFKAADTANNRQAFQHLGSPGNTSVVPYQRNTAYLFNSTGECFIFRGWANVSKVNDGFEVYIYDGLIDLYKSIENKSLSDLGLTELNHVKTLASVIDSWTSAIPFKYILADYGGKLYYDDTKINIDYLSPSVSTKYLWDKLFAYHGFTYSGSVFQTEDFVNHWMTFPKGLFATIPDEVVFESSDYSIPANGTPLQDFANTKDSAFLKFQSSTTDTLQGTIGNKHYIPGESGMYRLELSGTIKIFRLIAFLAGFDPFPHPVYTYTSYPQTVDLWLAKNQPGQMNADNIIPLIKLNDQPIGNIGDFSAVAFSINKIITLNEFDTFCLIFRAPTADLLLIQQTVPISFKLSKVVSQDVSFDTALVDFSQRDFVKEILIKFGLTPFPDKFGKHIEFLTMQERLQTPEVDNWSDKFVRVDGESYIFGNYAQQNVFAYNYNDKEGDYNNGAISIENVNLDDSKTVIKSKIYSPEKELVMYLDRPTNTYKLWDKEITDDETVTYKALDKRFYFLKSYNTSFPSRVIGSETLGTSTAITSAPVESFFRMKWSDILQDFYAPIQSILNKSKVQNIILDLKDNDVISLDFRKLKYIEQEGAYYILNKLNNYVSGKLAKAEMVRVFFAPPPPPPSGVVLQNVTLTHKPAGWYMKYSYWNYTGFPDVYANLDGVSTLVVPTLSFGNVHLSTLIAVSAGPHVLYLTCNGSVSNSITFTVPAGLDEIEEEP